MANQKKRKPGRPKLPKGETKGKIVPVRFTSDEMKRITAAAKADSMTVSDWIRRAINDGFGHVRRFRVAV